MTFPGLERFAAECRAEKGVKRGNLKDEFEREFGHGSISS